jgi:hypothetical protein
MMRSCKCFSHVNKIQPSRITLRVKNVKCDLATVTFPVFRLLTDLVCLLTYEFCLSLWKIARCSVILLLPLLALQLYSGGLFLFAEEIPPTCHNL